MQRATRYTDDRAGRAPPEAELARATAALVFSEPNAAGGVGRAAIAGHCVADLVRSHTDTETTP